MAFIKCSDPNEANNFLVLANGEAGIYRDINGSPTLFTPLQQVHTSVKNFAGAAVELNGRYERAPGVFLSPTDILTYSKNHAYVNQKAAIGDTSVSSRGNGKNAIAAGNGVQLKTIASTNAFFARQEYGMQAYSSFDGTTFTWINANTVLGPYSIPGLTYARAVLSGYHEVLDLSFTFSIGISQGTSQPTSWGTASMYIPEDGGVYAYFTLAAETYGSGNYLWYKLNGVLGHGGDADFFNSIRSCAIVYSISGARVSYGERSLAAPSNFSAVVLEVG